MTPEDRRLHVLAGLTNFRAMYEFDRVPVEVMLAQSQLETGGWKSGLCVNSNNAFGMTYPSQRPTNATGFVTTSAGYRFCTYASLEESAIDYLARQRYFHIPNTADPVTYINATVDSGYAEEADYAIAWANLIPGVDDHQLATDDDDGASTGGLVLGGLLLIAAAGWRMR